MAWRCFTLLALIGCKSDEEATGCSGFPDAATAPGHTLDNSDDCGHWEVATGAHIYINVVVTEADVPCEGTTEGAVTIPYDPIYSNLSDQDPKWTYDVQGVEPGSGSLDVSCDDGTTFEAMFTVI